MFIQRNDNGSIIGVYANAQEGYAEEEMANDSPDIVKFLNPPVTTSVTPFQAIQALNAAGKLAQVEGAIAAADKMTQYAWQRATSFDRHSDIVRLLSAGFGWTDADLDALFISAAGFV